MLPDTGPFQVVLAGLPMDVDARIRDALASSFRARYTIRTLGDADDPAWIAPPDALVTCLASPETLAPVLVARAATQASLILITAPAMEEEARRLILSGDADDYLPADQLSERLVEATVRAAAEASHLRRASSEPPPLAARLERMSRLQDAILAGTPDHFFVFDRNCVCTYASPRAARLLGLDDPSQIVGRTWHDIEPVAAYGMGLDADFIACIEDRKPVRRVVEHGGQPHRRWFEIILTPVLDEASGSQISDVVMTLHDISDFKQAEISLRQAILESYQFAVALENLHIGVVLTDPNRPSRPVTYVNPAFTTITGYAPEEVMGQGLDLLEGKDTDPEVREALHRALDTEQPFAGEILNYRKDGTTFWNELRITPVYDENGKLARFVELQNDVTERRVATTRFQRQIEFERLIASISAKFIRLSPGEVDAAIAQALADIGHYLGATHCVIGRFEGDVVRITHEWQAPGDIPVSEAMALGEASEELMAWLLAPLRALQPLFIPDVVASAKDIPQLASVAVVGLRALLVLPLVVGTQAIGAFALASIHDLPYWSPEDVTLFRLATEIFASGLDRKERQQALEESDQRFRVVVANAPIMLIAFNTEGRVTLTGGRSLDALFGDAPVTPGQLLGEAFGKAYPHALDVLENCQRALAGETLSAVLHAGPARQTVFELRYVPLRDGREQIVGGMLVGVDITERYKAEVAEREQRALAEALRDTASALNSSLDTNEVMRCIVESVDRVVPSEAATIILIEGREGRVVYTSGRHAFTLGDHYTPLRFSLTIPTLSTMIATGEPLLIPDVRESPDWFPVPESGWIRSYLGVPIRAYGKIIGFLNLDSATPGFFSTDHVERLQAIAGQAASALQNAQLYAVVRRDADELAFLNRATSFLSLSFVDTLSLADMSRRVVEAVAREFPTMDCRVLVLDENYQLVELARAGGYAPHLPSASRLEQRTAIAEAIWQGKGIFVPDAGPNSLYNPGDPRTRSELAIPLLTATDVIGVLDLQSEEYAAFSDRDRRILEAFAERAAAAIDNVRLYERIMRHTSELEERVRERTATLEAERAQLNAILESMTEAVIYGEVDITNVSWRSRFANHALWDMLGYRADDTPLENFPFSVFVAQHHPTTQAALQEALTRMAASGIVQKEIVMRRKDGSTFDVHAALIRVRAGTDGILEILCVLRDISQEKRLQEQKDRFIANASHELRTPITNLKMRLYLLARQPQHLEEHVAMLNQVAERMQDLVDDLLDVSRFERGVLVLQREPIILQNLVKDVVTLQHPHAEKRGLRLACQMPEHPVVANVDASRIVQVITNLVTNAINYTPEGGEVLVGLAIDESDGKRDILLWVRDTGIGIPPALQPQIFEPFFRVNVGTVRGTGLGLTITRDIVTLHGGTIDLNSVQGAGTTFTVRLPGLPPDAAHALTESAT
ncbi:MAG: PAS domain-containing protein [Anaerolineae bacterium]|nr:PAS domain-containing protein [Anaerolineae bacterium]